MRLVFIDDALTLGNPSSQSLFLALDNLLSSGISIEYWGAVMDSKYESRIKRRNIPRFNLPVVGSILNWFARNIVGGWYWYFDKEKAETIYLSTGGHFYFADLAWFHFYNRAWNDIQNKGVERGPESPLRQWLMQWGRFEDWVILKSPYLLKVLPVSDAIRDEIRKDYPSREVMTLPNAVDLDRFDVTKREDYQRYRTEFGFKNELVLLFVSQGHYTRKGFWLAIQALKAYREMEPSVPFKFVVLGGNEKQLLKLRRYLEREFVDWREFVELVGWTSRVQDYMAASDAMFYPSYFEAFSLVEIEAAAMGLPMILTRHHGSEMILKDGVNGYFCDHAIPSICEALEKFREAPLVIKEPSIGKALTVTEWSECFNEIIQNTMAVKAKEN